MNGQQALSLVTISQRFLMRKKRSVEFPLRTIVSRTAYRQTALGKWLFLGSRLLFKADTRQSKASDMLYTFN